MRSIRACSIGCRDMSSALPARTNRRHRTTGYRSSRSFTAVLSKLWQAPRLLAKTSRCLATFATSCGSGTPLISKACSCFTSFPCRARSSCFSVALSKKRSASSTCCAFKSFLARSCFRTTPVHSASLQFSMAPNMPQSCTDSSSPPRFTSSALACLMKSKSADGTSCSLLPPPSWPTMSAKSPDDRSTSRSLRTLAQLAAALD
mmetsp:Transcript_38549/g.69959  ORF Transcript_38549/g.69959 Transcript_38549/m.69959 type:complete len:204 (+) Transcript_38549:394-1005(+)